MGWVVGKWGGPPGRGPPLKVKYKKRKEKKFFFLGWGVFFRLLLTRKKIGAGPKKPIGP